MSLYFTYTSNCKLIVLDFSVNVTVMVKLNGYTFREATLLFLLFAFHLIMGQLLKKRICSPRSKRYFESAALSRKSNKKSQMLFPYIKMHWKK